MGSPVIRGLRLKGNEPQLTAALAAVFQAEPCAASVFVRDALALTSRGASMAPAVPEELACTTEERFAQGRVDLRFRAGDWDVIVELKIAAGYGHLQIERYLGALAPTTRHAYLVAVTRDLPAHGAPTAPDDRWLGAIQWRRLLPRLRELPVSRELESQWTSLLDVLEEEGSMGFTKPDPELFADFAKMRAASEHVEAFLGVLAHPLLAELRLALGGGDARAAFKGNKPGVSRSREGAAEYVFVVPAGGLPRVKAGLFAWKKPTRFSVAPLGAPRLLASRDPQSIAVCDALAAEGFRVPERDLRAFLPLADELLRSEMLEETVVTWARGRFDVLVEAGFFDLHGAAADEEASPADDDTA